MQENRVTISKLEIEKAKKRIGNLKVILALSWSPIRTE